MTLQRPDAARLLPVAGILAPVCAVLAARVFFTVGPAEAPGAVPAGQALPSLTTAAAPGRTRLTDAQAAALAYLGSLTRGEEIDSPMARPSAPTAGPITADPDLPAVPSYDPTQDLALSSVMGTGPRGIASISGRIYRLGEEIIAGWTLTAVDVRNRTATLTNTDGRVCVLRHLQDN
ncbi:MAG: hypothetical protein IT431_11295 [Phycisphaerales bacterium]|nr:hypothetical protein [Phycisphaerales bacterium]